MKRLYIFLWLCAFIFFFKEIKAQPSYCIPAMSTGCASDYISSFAFGTMQNNTSGCNGNINGYINYPITSFTSTVIKGESISFNMSSGPTYQQYFAMWIDYNNDGDFDDSGEFIYSSATKGSYFSGSTTIPEQNGISGERRLRIRCNWDLNLSASNSCTAATYGETEDYTITILDINIYNGGIADGYNEQDNSFISPFTPSFSGSTGDGYSKVDNSFLTSIHPSFTGSSGDGYHLASSQIFTSFYPNLTGSTGDGYHLASSQIFTSFYPNLTGSTGDGYHLSSFTHNNNILPNFLGSTGDGYNMNSSAFLTTIYTNLNGSTGDGYSSTESSYSNIFFPNLSGSTADGYSMLNSSWQNNIFPELTGSTNDGYSSDSSSISLNPWCIPTVSGGCSMFGGDLIDNVILNTLSNTSSGCNGNVNGYIKYPSSQFTTSLEAGLSYNMTVQTGSANNEYIAVWVDWNDDKDFDDDGEIICNPTEKISSYTFPLNVPLDEGFIGERKMRVRCSFSPKLNSTDACTLVQYGETEDYTITVLPPSFKNLQITLYLEGLYNGSGGMNKAQDESGDHFTGEIADQVNIDIHAGTSPFALLHTISGLNLQTDGSVSCNIASSFNNSYYLAVRHRNSIETWTASPISFVENTISYNFTDNASKAFGSNLKNISGNFIIYGGDVNQDGFVDSGDMTPVDNDASNFMMGYIFSDINGDGFVDSADMTIIDNNAANFISMITP
ncbi:MAG: GEVED domain-containing protein [Lentimicrobiaceae bacterium]|nr:GEVED domain-containing protein [Lentimicrobiaceae bacterium]